MDFNRRSNLGPAKRILLLSFTVVLLLTSMYSIQLLTSELANTDQASTIDNEQNMPTNDLEIQDINYAYISQVKNWDENYGDPTRMVIKEELIFYTNPDEGLVIINSSDLENPTIESTYGEYGEQVFYDFYVDDNILYICDVYTGFKSIDISDLENPVVLDQLAFYYPYNVKVVGDIAYVIDYQGQLYSLNISNPSDLQTIDWHDFETYITSLFIKEDLIFIGHRSNGFSICNISNPNNFTYISSYTTTPDSASVNIWVEENTVFIADREEGLEIVNITDLEQPTFISKYKTSEEMYCNDVIVCDSIAYLADYYSGIIILNLTDLKNPEKINTIQNSVGSTELEILNDILFSSDYFENLLIYNISTKTAPIEVSTFYGGGRAWDVVVDDTIAFIANNNGLVIVDCREYEPVTIGRYSDGKLYRSIAIQNEYVFLSDMLGYYFTVINVTNPHDPIKISSFAFEDNTTNIRSVFVRDNKMFLACEEKGLITVDISNPQVPEIIGSFTLNSIIAVELKNNYAYVIDETDGVVVLDITNTDDIKVVKTLSFDSTLYIHHLTIEGKYLYVISNSQFYIFDISRKGIPRLKGYVNSYGEENGPFPDRFDVHFGEITIQDDLAFVTVSYLGLYMFDISNKKNPVLAGYYFDDCEAIGVYADETFVYVAKVRFGFSIYTSMIHPKSVLGAGWITLIVIGGVVLITVPLVLFMRYRKKKKLE